MKLMYKINLVGLAVLVAVGLAIAAAGVSIISRESYNLNREVMTREVNNIISIIQGGYDVLAANGLEGIESYRIQAQNDILEELSSFEFRKSGVLMIVSDQGTVIKHPAIEPGNTFDMEQVEDMVRSRSGSMELSYRGQNRFFKYKLFPRWHWLVILSVTSEEMLAARDQFMGQVVVILIMSLMLGALIFIWFIRRVVEPVRQLAYATTYVSEGKWDTPLPEPESSDEVAQLTVAFRKMAVRLAEMYGSLQSNLQQIERSRSALKESEEKYRGLVELLPLVVYEATADGQFIFANRYAVDTFGYSAEEFADGLFLHDICARSDRERIIVNIKNVLRGEHLGMMEYTGKRKNLSTFPCISLATPIFHQAKPIGVRGIFIDITERKTLENELQQAREFLDTILNNVADPVFVKDVERRYILVNDAFCLFLGHSREEILGKSEQDFFTEEETASFWQQDDLVFSTQQAHEKEETVTSSNDNRLVILTKKAVFKDSRGESLLVGIIKDITKRKQMEQELFKSDKLKSIGVLAGGIAHDFNNILTAIIGNLSLAKMLAKPESKLGQYIVASEKASTQAKDLTQQLLTFSRGGAPVKRTVSLCGVIEELVMFSLRGSKVGCDLDLAEDLWPVDVDEGQISRVIHNLVVNASQAMPDGGTVRISAFNHVLHAAGSLPLRPGRFVRLVVQDHGVGIPQELLGNIFDPYFTTKENGSGLGLATAFSILKRHDGYIGVESEPNIGTTFNIYLPASSEPVSTAEPEETVVHSGQGRIMVMDDEPLVREVVGDMLATLGYSYELVSDGFEAVEKYERALNSNMPVDLVIMDLTIPGGMGGQEAIKKLMAIDSGAKAIVASGYSKDPVMADFKKYGFAGVLIKPFELDKLSSILRQVLHESDG